MRSVHRSPVAASVRGALAALISALIAALIGGLLAGCEPADAPAPVQGPPEQTVRFTEVTEAAGLGGFRHDNGRFGQAWAPEIVGGGAAFLDYDGDGWEDILLVGGGPFAGRTDRTPNALRLYRNNGDGTFGEATEEAGLGGITAYGLGLAAADADNDGDTDVLLTTLYENRFFYNSGGVFTEATSAAGLGGPSEWSTSALFFDADRDGWLDLYVANYVDWSPEKDIYCAFQGEKVYCTPQEYTGLGGRYYHNDGDGTFTDRTDAAGLAAGIEAARDKALGVAEWDFNADGWPDLFVANDTERDLLYVNDGDGTFTEKGTRSGIAFSKHGKPRAGMGLDLGVIDTTGQVSMVVGNFSDETVGVYRHLGGGLFIDRAAAAQVGHPSMNTLTFGLFLFDVDLDGDLDLLTANGHVQTHIERMVEGITFRQRTQLYLNRGDGTFDEAPARGPLDHPMVARGAAYADYDRDGDLDVLITENDGPAHLWRNDSATGAHVALQLVGRWSNRDAVGAHVVLYAGGRGQERRVRTGSSYLSQSTLWQHFGLGGAAAVDSVVVTWPSGAVERHGPVPVGGAVRIIEGQPTLETRSPAATEGVPVDQDQSQR